LALGKLSTAVAVNLTILSLGQCLVRWKVFFAIHRTKPLAPIAKRLFRS
jgi:hypothetical protein